MIEDMLRLTIDQVFPKRSIQKMKSRKLLDDEQYKRVHPVQGYSDTENMW